MSGASMFRKQLDRLEKSEWLDFRKSFIRMSFENLTYRPCDRDISALRSGRPMVGAVLIPGRPNSIDDSFCLFSFVALGRDGPNCSATLRACSLVSPAHHHPLFQRTIAIGLL